MKNENYFLFFDIYYHVLWHCGYNYRKKSVPACSLLIGRINFLRINISINKA